MSFNVSNMLHKLATGDDVYMAKIRSSSTFEFDIKWWKFDMRNLVGVEMVGPGLDKNAQRLDSMRFATRTQTLNFDAWLDHSLTYTGDALHWVAANGTLKLPLVPSDEQLKLGAGRSTFTVTMATEIGSAGD